MSFIHPDDIQNTEHRILERRSGKRDIEDTEVRLSIRKTESDRTLEQASDETWTSFYISNSGLYSDDTLSPESFVGIQGIARDVSRAKHFEQQVLRLAAVVEQAAEDVIIPGSA